MEDSIGNILGKMVTIYGHIDLNLDSLDNRLLNGQFVSQGDTVSKHLYSGTVGGPHLHFEIRYYRPGDTGDEKFYGFVLPGPPSNLTAHSTGSWLYGYWDPNVGYGFADPENHLSGIVSEINDINNVQNIVVFPNPTTGLVTVKLAELTENLSVFIYNQKGQLVFYRDYCSVNQIRIDCSSFNKGVFLLKAVNSMNHAEFVKQIIIE